MDFALTLILSFYFFRTPGASLSIYKDSSRDPTLGPQSEMSKSEVKTWHSLGARAERNKENNAIPSKWTSNKVSTL